MFNLRKSHRLDAGIMARIESCRELLSNTKTVPAMLRGKSYPVEYLVIPAITSDGALKTPIFNYPGGLTNLAHCIEPFLYLDQESIHISPLGYGKSSDIPESIFGSEPLHGAKVSLQVVRALGKNKVILYGHSNASSVTMEIALRAQEFGIEVERVILVNPLGLRGISRVVAALAHSISGMLTRLGSWRYEHPFNFLKDAYRSPGHPFSLQKIIYELGKSSRERLPAMFQEMQRRKLKIPINVVQSSGDWGRFHWPWQKSNEEVLLKNIPHHLLSTVRMQGLHNVTLGKDSRSLAYKLIYLKIN